MDELEYKQRGFFGMIMRVVWGLIALNLAILVALAILMALGGYWMGDELREGQNLDGDMGYVISLLSMLVGGASFFTGALPALTPYPALLAALVGEATRIRSWMYYVVAGGLAMIAIPLLDSEPGTPFDAKMMTVFATAGFAGGWIYWLLSGRNA